MNIYVIIQVIKNYKEFDVIHVLFKTSWIFQRFEWYGSHFQGKMLNVKFT